MTDVSTDEQPSRLNQIYADSKRRRGIPVSGFAGNGELLDQVRQFEKAGAAKIQPASFASAKVEDLERLSLIDPLTELYNHRTFIKELKAELNRAKRYRHAVALSMIQIDDFDEISNHYGFLTGEAVLKVVANVLRGALREVDITAKYSDQQFVIALPQTHAAGASLVAERIRQRIGNQAVTHNWQSFSVTASIGVAAFPAHAEEYDELIARSMEALSYAIARGGDRVFSI